MVPVVGKVVYSCSGYEVTRALASVAAYYMRHKVHNQYPIVVLSTSNFNLSPAAPVNSPLGAQHGVNQPCDYKQTRPND